jgi:hypothetical protein
VQVDESGSCRVYSCEIVDEYRNITYWVYEELRYLLRNSEDCLFRRELLPRAVSLFVADTMRPIKSISTLGSRSCA